MADRIAQTRSNPPPTLEELKERRENFAKNKLGSQTTPSNTIIKVDRSQADPAVVKAAEGMEGMFIDYMMQVMRKTVPKSEFSMDSAASEIYQSMLDGEYAQKAIQAGGVGLSDQIIAYLEMQRYNQVSAPKDMARADAGSQEKAQVDAKKDVSTGGTKHESQLQHTAKRPK